MNQLCPHHSAKVPAPCTVLPSNSDRAPNPRPPELLNLILTLEVPGTPQTVPKPEAQVRDRKESEQKPALTCSLIVGMRQHQEQHFYQVGVKMTLSRHGSLHCHLRQTQNPSSNLNLFSENS